MEQGRQLCLNEQCWRLVREILCFIISWLARRQVECGAEHECFLHPGQGYSEPQTTKQREEVTDTNKPSCHPEQMLVYLAQVLGLPSFPF